MLSLQLQLKSDTGQIHGATQGEASGFPRYLVRTAPLLLAPVGQGRSSLLEEAEWEHELEMDIEAQLVAQMKLRGPQTTRRSSGTRCTPSGPSSRFTVTRSG